MKATITIEVTAPTTPEGETLYLSGSHNAWKTGDAQYAFAAVGEGRYRLSLELSKGTMLEYKLNRGNWTTSEVDEAGLEPENRRLAVFGSTTVQVTVHHWRDQASRSADRPRKTADRVKVLGPFPIPILGRDREVVVYLPSNYEAEPSRRFPVMYMWDGQNLFDPATSFNMPWGVDETCDRLIAAGELEPMIVVGIYNGGEHRISEQSPWRDARLKANGEGHAFLRWVVDWLKSYIDTEYRTLTGPEHTGVAGSSLGGLTAMYAAYRYPLVFGRVAALSPAFWFAKSQIFRYVAARPRPEGAKVYLDCGERETARVHPKRDFYKVAACMVDLLRQQGFTDGKDLMWVSDPRGVHSEWCWGARIGPAMRFLFPGPVARETAGEAAGVLTRV